MPARWLLADHPPSSAPDWPGLAHDTWVVENVRILPRSPASVKPCPEPGEFVGPLGPISDLGRFGAPQTRRQLLAPCSNSTSHAGLSTYITDQNDRFLDYPGILPDEFLYAFPPAQGIRLKTRPRHVVILDVRRGDTHPRNSLKRIDDRTESIHRVLITWSVPRRRARRRRLERRTRSFG